MKSLLAMVSCSAIALSVAVPLLADTIKDSQIKLELTSIQNKDFRNKQFTPSIVGNWKASVNEKGVATDIYFNVKSDATFDSTFQFNGESKSRSGNWEYSNNVLTTWTENQEFEGQGTIKWISNDEFILTIQDNGDRYYEGVQRRYYRQKQSVTQKAQQDILVTQNTKQQRIALVIGNADYSVGRLNNSVNDANEMATALQEVGFEVIKITDANLLTMESALDRLSSRLKDGAVGLFYYAGHGVQVNGENYLIPLQAEIDRAQDVRYEALPVGKVLSLMEDRENDTNIVILDACRDNPFARQWRTVQRGLAAPGQTTTGSLIAYATAPGKVAEDGIGSNGTYTSNILKHIRTPNLDVELMFKKVRQGVIEETKSRQTPWESSSLIGSFSFNVQPNVQPIEEVAVSDSISQSDNNPEEPGENQVAYNSSSSNLNYVLSRNLEGHSKRVNSIAITPDGQRVVSGSDDETIKIWDINTGKLEFTFEESKSHSKRVNSIAITPDGQRVVSGSCSDPKS